MKRHVSLCLFDFLQGPTQSQMFLSYEMIRCRDIYVNINIWLFVWVLEFDAESF
jgi:hypothetical protein